MAEHALALAVHGEERLRVAAVLVGLEQAVARASTRISAEG